MFVPIAVKTAGMWNHLAVELIQQVGWRISAVTQDTRETGFLFQRLSVALQRGNAVFFGPSTTLSPWNTRRSLWSYHLPSIFLPTGFVTAGSKILVMIIIIMILIIIIIIDARYRTYVVSRGRPWDCRLQCRVLTVRMCLVVAVKPQRLLTNLHSREMLLSLLSDQPETLQ